MIINGYLGELGYGMFFGFVSVLIGMGLSMMDHLFKPSFFSRED